MAEKHEGGDNRSFEQKRIAGVQKPRLFQHVPHPHIPHNVNLLHAAEKAAGGFNDQIAVGMTKLFSSMPMFWVIVVWMIIWIAGNLTLLHFDPAPFPLLLLLINLPQLALMIVIMVGQGLLGRHQEIQAEEQFATTQKSFSDIEQIIEHLGRQDEELLKHTAILTAIAQMMSGEGTHGDSTK